jgi:hypothetical protein
VYKNRAKPRPNKKKIGKIQRGTRPANKKQELTPAFVFGNIPLFVAASNAVLEH